MINDKLSEKNYPDFLKMNDGTAVTKENVCEKRKELLSLLETHSYGKTPKLPVRVWGKTASSDGSNYAYGGKVLNEKVDIFMETELGLFSFPVEIFIPQNVKNPPAFLHIAFKPVPDKYIPVEEITDSGFALVVMVYEDVVNDKHFGDYSDGIAKYFGTDNPREADEWGKIGMWAYAASRVMDYLEAERTDIDTKKVAVIGHSRLGKTALWCGAQDERFAAVISNNSGYGGAASSIKGKGERVSDFVEVGSWDWFAENFKLYADDKEDKKPYDQSFLLALIAPRLLCVGSAILDHGADPEAEFLTSLHASKMWEVYGKNGLVCSDNMPEPGDKFFDGNVGYHLRDYGHFLSREDWNAYIEFLKNKGF
ncbi:MAG: alpha/beta hydrolase [Clostridia bacterium]|nr:alpha/beta hydrolase [Clostridia bacterium]